MALKPFLDRKSIKSTREIEQMPPNARIQSNKDCKICSLRTKLGHSTPALFQLARAMELWIEDVKDRHLSLHFQSFLKEKGVSLEL